MLAMVVYDLVDWDFNGYWFWDSYWNVFFNRYWDWFLNMVVNFFFYFIWYWFLNWDRDGFDDWHSHRLRYFHVDWIGLWYWNCHWFRYRNGDRVWNGNGFVLVYWNWDVLGDFYGVGDVMATTSVVSIASFVTAVDGIYG